MPEHIRIGDIVVELRPSYGAGAGCEVKIDNLTIHGKPDAPTVTLALRIDRPDPPLPEEDELEGVDIVEDTGADKGDYIAELDNVMAPVRDEEPPGGNS